MAIKTGIVGAAGFAGIELTRLVLHHPGLELTVVTSNELAGAPISDEYPGFAGATSLVFSKHDNPDLYQCDLVFLAVPHTAALAMAPSFVDKGIAVIDLSADFRLKNPHVYEQWYGVLHKELDLLEQAAFGLPELFPDDLKRLAQDKAEGKGVLVACAGCYPTATSLAAAPLLRAGLACDNATVVVDAISGISGAGKAPTTRTHFCSANENIEAYGVSTHRHTPEIEQILGIENRLVFTPHLAPSNRGLLSTVYLSLAGNVSTDYDSIEKVYRSFYEESPFVRVLDNRAMPKTSSVVGTNNAHIGFAVHDATRTVIAVCAIDNLAKGAAGQAVQCANVVLGFPENCGFDLMAIPV